MMNEYPDGGDLMTDVYTARELIEELSKHPPETPVMICVVKYPDEFRIRRDASTGDARWDTSDDTEVQLLEEVHTIDGTIMLTVELDDYNAERHMVGGMSATD